MEEERGLVAGLTQQHLAAISCLLYFYERHLWHFAAPSTKRTKQLTELQFLLVKIQLLSMTMIGTLSPDDIGYIDTVIQVFVKQAKEKIPQSESRDEVLASCEELCNYLVKTLR